MPDSRTSCCCSSTWRWGPWSALSRHLVIDGQKVSDGFHLYLLLTITGSILVPSLAILVLAYTGRRFGRPEDDVSDAGDAG